MTGGLAVSVSPGGARRRPRHPGHRRPRPPLRRSPDRRPPTTARTTSNTEAFTGADGTASAIGWEGNHQGVVTCLGGTFFVQDGINKNYGFGIYTGAPTTWADADGYLPAQITTFQTLGANVSITEFADQVVLGGDAYVAVYSRVAVRNPTDQPSSWPTRTPRRAWCRSTTLPTRWSPTRRSIHDYVVAVDRFGHNYPWPTRAGAGRRRRLRPALRPHAELLEPAAGRDRRRSPSPTPRSTTPTAAGSSTPRSPGAATHLNTGVNGYESEFSHDVVGILANLFTQGYFSDAHALLLEARNVVGSQGASTRTALWTYAWPWAIYLMKTGDLSFVKENFSTEGPSGPPEPSIEDTAHAIAADRTGPGGIMGRPTTSTPTATGPSTTTRP